MSRKVVDIETNDLLANMLDFSKMPYKLKEDSKLWCISVRDVDTNEVVTLKSAFGNTITKSMLMRALDGVTEIIAHNGIKFDFIALKLFGIFDYTIGYLGREDTCYGKPVKFTDTLIRSRLFNPDRKGGHSLKSWGERNGDYKDDFREQSIEAGLIDRNSPKGQEFKVYSDIMCSYCDQDTNVTAKTFLKLEEEHGGYTGWDQAEKLENKLADIAIRRESYGLWFDKELAIANLEYLTREMEELYNRVTPILPMKKLTKVKLKDVTPPEKQFLKDSTPNANIKKFLLKNGIDGISEDTDGTYYVVYKGERLNLPLTEPLYTHEKSSIDDLDVVKEHLISLGWKPSEWKIRDLSKDSKKQALPFQKQVEAMDRWLDQTFDDGKYKKLRLQELGKGKTKSAVRSKLIDALNKKRPCKVPTSPCVRTGIEKELCKNLQSLGDKVSFAKDFVLYLTYKHRKSSIAGGDIEEIDFDEESPNTGYLAIYRDIDGRVPTPAIEIGASTNRYKHIGVCNVPRASSIFGSEMRSMFGAGNSMYQLGFDFSSLEACIQGHYILPFNGEELANQLLAKKPNDIHCYSEDTEILTESGWKFFGSLTSNDKVAQYDNGKIEFVKPTEVVWQKYSGDMYIDPITKFKVTPNHRVLYKSFSSGNASIVMADKFIPTSDKRYIVGGVKEGKSLELSSSFIKLLVATQADGNLSKDCSAISFSFVKKRKLERLLSILDDLDSEYTVTNYFRKGRNEVVVRLKSSSLSVKVRSYLGDRKSFSTKLLGLDSKSLTVLLEEVGHWDGTLKENGDLVFDTTDRISCEFIQTVASLLGKKTNFHDYVKNTSFGSCKIYRVYVSNKFKAVKSANKPYVVVDYDGYVGCVSVPSGLVLVKRNNSIVVSGNTINAKKLGIDRDFAKAISYMLMYGGSAKRAQAMLGCSYEEAVAIVEGYWNAVPALRDLRDAVKSVWKKRGGTYVVGVDGRLIRTRSEHSLLNALFQSGGVICAKYATVYLYQLMEDAGYKCNPFEDDKMDMSSMIEYHDECQLAVSKDLIKFKTFDTIDLFEEFSKTWKGEKLGSPVELTNGKIAVALPNIVSMSIEKAINLAVEKVSLKVPLGMEWVVGKNWYQCH